MGSKECQICYTTDIQLLNSELMEIYNKLQYNCLCGTAVALGDFPKHG